jgi:hypothetical protein
LELDDRFGALQAQREAGIVVLNASRVGGQLTGFGSFRATLRWSQCAGGSGISLAAPVGEGQGVESLAPQDSADGAGLCRAIGLGQSAKLVLCSERPAARAIG